MYQFSRGIYRELAGELTPCRSTEAHIQLLAACERSMERLAADRYYFARPTRTIFNDIRMLFPVARQQHVLDVVTRYVAHAEAYLAELPAGGASCRAMTRKGTSCQRTPLARNGYCPSHQHLADTEQCEAPLAA